MRKPTILMVLLCFLVLSIFCYADYSMFWKKIWNENCDNWDYWDIHAGWIIYNNGLNNYFKASTDDPNQLKSIQFDDRNFTQTNISIWADIELDVGLFNWGEITCWVQDLDDGTDYKTILYRKESGGVSPGSSIYHINLSEYINMTNATRFKCLCNGLHGDCLLDYFYEYGQDDYCSCNPDHDCIINATVCKKSNENSHSDGYKFTLLGNYLWTYSFRHNFTGYHNLEFGSNHGKVVLFNSTLNSGLVRAT